MACAVSGCEKSASRKDGGAKGFCRAHHRRLWRHGSPTGGTTGRGDAQSWLERAIASDSKECVIWPFARTPKGYAIISCPASGKMRSASRVVCERVNGPPPADDMEAAHSCGNGMGGCINPAHIRWATRSENNQEKAAYGTMPFGERSHLAKLTADAVREIRANAKGLSQRGLAVGFGVKQQQISRIQLRQRWAAEA